MTQYSSPAQHRQSSPYYQPAAIAQDPHTFKTSKENARGRPSADTDVSNNTFGSHHAEENKLILAKEAAIMINQHFIDTAQQKIQVLGMPIAS